MRQESSFRCSNCRLILSVDPLGTKHRNHCPWCLWSKHVDLATPGDRRSNCCARMKPVAMALRRDGELMVLHQCLNCGKLSPNRISGDDNEYTILYILKESINLDKNILNRINNLGLDPITNLNKEEALISLFGLNYKEYVIKYPLV